jgi:DNA-binding CsgD family transcriptional regulator
MPLIVGQERVRHVLAEQFSAAAACAGRLVLIGGEAGIGKTTLVRWLAQEADSRGALVLNGGCYDLTATPAYGPWLDAIERYLPAGDDPPPPLLAAAAPTDTRTWFETVQTFLTALATCRPLVLILEDLHWSDPASLDLLRHLARRLDRLPVLLAGTYRDDEITREHSLFQLLPLLVRETGAERIDLRRLDRADINATTSNRYALSTTEQQRLTAYLARNSDGNPLYLTELLRTLEGERLLRDDGERWTLLELRDALVPPLLHQLIDRRLARLLPATRDALAIAAIIGEHLSIDLWSGISDLSSEQLADIVGEAVEAHVLEELPGSAGLRFSHALIREVLYATMALPRRRVWHLRVAETLLVAPAASPDEVAYHFQQAGDDRAVEWFVRAGIRARRADAWITAAERFATAASLLEDDDNRIRERGWLLFLVGFLLRFSDGARSIIAHDEAERLAVIAGEPALAAYANYARGAVRSMRTDVLRGLRDLETGVRAIDALLPDHRLLSTEQQAMAGFGTLLNQSGRVSSKTPNPEPRIPPEVIPRVNMQRGVLINHYSHAGRYPEVISIGEPYLAEMRAALGADSIRNPQCFSGLHGIGHAYAARGRVEDARAMFAIARAGAESFNDQAIVEMTLWSEQLMVLVPYFTDRPEERRKLIADARRAWERCVGMSIVVAGDGAPSETQADLLEGRWATARQLAIDHLGAPWINMAHEAIVVLGVLDHRQGQPDNAWQRVFQLLPQGPATEPGNVYFAHAIVAIELAANLALDAGDVATARDWTETHSRWLDWNGARLWRADTQLLWARYHRQIGDPNSARQHADAALTLASDPRQPLRIVAAERLLGQLDANAANAESATDRLVRSLELAEACVAPYEQALSLLELAELRLHTGRTVDARTLLDRARTICATLDARPLLARATALEARTGASTTRPDGLTTREVEVLRLIAAGDSNRQIADTLFLSPRTIERHIANIYLKIDAHSKAEATAYARRNSLA